MLAGIEYSVAMMTVIGDQYWCNVMEDLYSTSSVESLRSAPHCDNCISMYYYDLEIIFAWKKCSFLSYTSLSYVVMNAVLLCARILNYWIIPVANGSLTLHNVQLHNSGMYQCFAENSVGVAYALARLAVGVRQSDVDVNSLLHDEVQDVATNSRHLFFPTEVGGSWPVWGLDTWLNDFWNLLALGRNI